VRVVAVAVLFAGTLAMVPAQPAFDTGALQPGDAWILMDGDVPGAMAAAEEAGLRVFRLPQLDMAIVGASAASVALLEAHFGVVATPDWTEQLHLDKSVPYIDVPAVRDLVGYARTGPTVLVIDTGVSSAHPDFQDGNLAANIRSSQNGGVIDAILQDVPVVDPSGHGTHVAGIVAAEDNGIGTLGVAPDATIIGVKVLHGGSGSFGAVIGGILYASDPAAFGAASCARADIINMSLGAVFPKSASGAGPLVGALNQAVNFAASQGVLVISAAGNNGVDIRDFPSFTFVPADSGSGLAVSATGPVGFALGATNFRRPASYSNFGSGFVQVAGPGGDFVLPGDDVCAVPTNGGPPVVNFCWVFDLVISTCRGPAASTTSYCFAAGTSMATPAVAGVAALIKAANPGISLGALKTKLFQSADDEGALGNDAFYGHGFANAFRACTE